MTAASGPLLAAHPELVLEVPSTAPTRTSTRSPTWRALEGEDGVIRADASAAEAAWAAQVRANREQVDRLREVPDGRDFYAPGHDLFVADPRRTGEAVLDELRALAWRASAWLDIGAGAGRYALPLALVCG